MDLGLLGALELELELEELEQVGNWGGRSAFCLLSRNVGGVERDCRVVSRRSCGRRFMDLGGRRQRRGVEGAGRVG